jgi:hypothetical protein
VNTCTICGRLGQSITTVGCEHCRTSQNDLAVYNENYKAKGYHSKSEMRRVEIMKAEDAKPREWFIYDGHSEVPQISGPAIAYAETIHVVEYSALTEANARLEIALKALEEIAEWNEDAYEVCIEALAKIKGMG